jgi:Zn-dependent M28 family amino/carboxypeptidase
MRTHSRTFRIALLGSVSAAALMSACAAAPTPAAPGTGLPISDGARAREIVAAVDPNELRATDTKLVSFGTRHSMSDTKSDTRGIGAARRWVQSRFEQISRDCGGCLTIATPSQTFSGSRLAVPTEIMDVIAIQKGTTEPERVVLIAGHLDSRNSDANDFTNDAPGANDDASGTSAAIEAARVLSKYRFRATVVYAALSGEEQGLYGGKVLAEYAKAQGWKVEADLNNDIVGNSYGENGVHDSSTVRVFSEGTKAVETAQQANRRRYNGGENDSPARNIARYMATIAERDMANFNVKMVYRTDRFGRGGDQVPFLELGYPAVRVTEANEHYDRQHQNVRTENGRKYGDVVEWVDFDYLAKVTRLNALTLAALASAPRPPSGVTIEGAVKHDTTLGWQPVPGAVGYRLWWRDTTASQWEHHRDVKITEGAPIRFVLNDIVIDDWMFGVSAVDEFGNASPVVYPGDAGSFESAAPSAMPPAAPTR